MDEAHRRRGLYIIGTTGSGKTTLLQDLVLQDVNAMTGLCLLDPHGDLVDRVIERIPRDRTGDVVLLDPRDTAWPFGLNPFWCQDFASVVAAVVGIGQMLFGVRVIVRGSIEVERAGAPSLRLEGWKANAVAAVAILLGAVLLLLAVAVML